MAKIKKLVLIGAVVGSAFAGLAALSNDYMSKQWKVKKADNLKDAERCIQVHSDNQIKGTTKACERVNSKLLKGESATQFKSAFAKHKQTQAEEKAEAKRSYEEAVKTQQARIAAVAKEKADADAKFKAEGWFQLSSGIYGRWCTQTCSRASVIGDAAYWLLEVWAKDRAAGDIYARINVMQNGVVVGWTNDTTYLAQGQKGVMTFTKYLPGNGSSYRAQLTEFNARG